MIIIHGGVTIEDIGNICDQHISNPPVKSDIVVDIGNWRFSYLFCLAGLIYLERRKSPLFELEHFY